MNRYSPLPAFAIALIAVTATGCAAPQTSGTDAVPPVIEHIHGVAADPNSENLFVATHGGIFTLTPEGALAGLIGGYDFDAMGFTVLDDALLASGHPGTQTPAELGSPNLGVIRSDDFGETWSPIALTGTTDFHTLTAGPDGTLYGIASDGVDLLISTDNGREWNRGATLAAADLAATNDGLYAAAEEGLLLSTDNGASFAPVADAPLLYALDVRPDGTLAGVGTDGALWSQNTEGTWQRLDPLQGAAQAFTAIGDDSFVVVDDRGIVQIAPDDTTVLAPVR
ncbi:F510_1955 family glycosylhydrolase [Microbacterium sp.]